MPEVFTPTIFKNQYPPLNKEVFWLDISVSKFKQYNIDTEEWELLGGSGSGETTESIKIKLGQASALQDGYLTDTDWSTFNDKVSSSQLTTAIDDAIAGLRDGVATEGDTLQKLYNIIIGSFKEIPVDDIAARDAYDVTSLPTNVFVADDGDGKWALYKATTTGVGATFVKINDQDSLTNALSASAIKVSYESNSDTNAFTNALKAKLDAILGTNTGDEDAASIAIINHAASSKGTLVDTDELTGQDSASSFSLIRATCLNLWLYIKSKADLIYNYVVVSDDAYDSSWNGSLDAPTKNAVYDKIETLGSAIIIQEEGVSLATAATTLNYVGDGVTTSGTGTTKTIYIPGNPISANLFNYYNFS